MASRGSNWGEPRCRPLLESGITTLPAQLLILLHADRVYAVDRAVVLKKCDLAIIASE